MSFVEIASDKGHDAFLLDEPDFHRTLAGFLAGCAEHARLPGLAVLPGLAAAAIGGRA